MLISVTVVHPEHVWAPTPGEHFWSPSLPLHASHLPVRVSIHGRKSRACWGWADSLQGGPQSRGNRRFVSLLFRLCMSFESFAQVRDVIGYILKILRDSMTCLQVQLIPLENLHAQRDEVQGGYRCPKCCNLGHNGRRLLLWKPSIGCSFEWPSIKWQYTPRHKRVSQSPFIELYFSTI